MNAPLVFLDTETTGLARTDEIWEVGAIRREPDGSEAALHVFVVHDPSKCARLPEPFLTDHRMRYPGECGNGKAPDVPMSPWLMANELDRFTARREGELRAHIVGAVPNFDTARIERPFDEFELAWEWHYHLLDVENLAVGYLLATAREMSRNAGRDADVMDRADELREIASPPWDSEELSRAVGVEPDRFGRHTALGDASWARAMFDAVVGGGA